MSSKHKPNLTECGGEITIKKIFRLSEGCYMRYQTSFFFMKQDNFVHKKVLKNYFLLFSFNSFPADNLNITVNTCIRCRTELCYNFAFIYCLIKDILALKA